MKCEIKIGKKRKRIINKNIYGHFIEHLKRCIYGGIYEENSSLSDENGFRKDVLGAIKKLNVPVLRWPGGNFASNYHFLDGIGPKEKRPKKLDTAWMAEDNNHFGTEEFLKYCEIIKAQPYICLNFGTGTLDEALGWVEYCNYDGNTYYADIRRKYGKEKPHKVKYWGLGNEIYGKWQHGYCEVDQYAEKARQCSQFIKKIDPEIKTIAVGADNPDWDINVIKIAGETIDYISIHAYFSSDDYFTIAGLPYYVDKRMDILESSIKVGENYIKREKPIEIAFDEWNIWRKPLDDEENYKLSDGIFACGFFHILQKHCERVTMANLAQLVNVLGAIQTKGKGVILTPIYYAFYLYSNNTGDFLLDSEVKVEKYNFQYRNEKIENVPFIDVSATEDEKNIYVAVINRNTEKVDGKIEIENNFKKEGKILTMTGNSPEAINTTEKQEVEIMEENFKKFSDKLNYSFLPYSTTILKIEKNG
ncbi:MAG TPA: alpha-L-arabinofuranosidase C-terminal domain-containing protein [Candidatus Ratteibacteria bacterium]|nr:alpha-L-arabinofuranosidase C-terminal domain-containing protein [Candidatus Ratteibacteria bacterium]